MDADTYGHEPPAIENLITDLILTRMTTVRETNPELADEYERLAVYGHVNPELYAAVLRFAGQAISVRRLDVRRAPDLADAA